MKYNEYIVLFEECLNFKSTNPLKAKQNKQLFLSCVKGFKKMGFEISTKFLSGFVEGDFKQKSNRVAYMLKSVGLNGRNRVIDGYFEKFPSTTIKEVDIRSFRSVEGLNGEEVILCNNQKVNMLQNGTISDSWYKPKKQKVAISSRKFRSITLHNIA